MALTTFIPECRTAGAFKLLEMDVMFSRPGELSAKIIKQARTESQVLGNERGTVHQANSELALKKNVRCRAPQTL